MGAPVNEEVTTGIPVNEVIRIVNELSGLPLGVEESRANTNGAQINQYTDTGNDYQRWRLKPAGVGNEGFYNIENVGSGMSMEVFTASTKGGEAITQWAYEDGPHHRQWELIPVVGDAYKIKNRNSHLFLDDVDGRTHPPAPVRQYNSWEDWPRDSRQNWKLIRVGTT